MAAVGRSASLELQDWCGSVVDDRHADVGSLSTEDVRTVADGTLPLPWVRRWSPPPDEVAGGLPFYVVAWRVVATPTHVCEEDPRWPSGRTS